LFEKLIDIIINFIDNIIPFVIIKEYNRGVRFRFGKFNSVLEPGISIKIPFFDNIDEVTVVTTTLSIPVQSITTLDKKQIVTKAVVRYNISDVKPFMLTIYDSVDAISDTTQAIIKKQLASKNLEDCVDNKIDILITKNVAKEVIKWGVTIEKVTLTDIGEISSIRLFNENDAIG